MNTPNQDISADEQAVPASEGEAAAAPASPQAAPAPAPIPPTDNRRRQLRDLLSIPERDRSDEQWDQIIELEIQLAPGNRLAPNEQPHNPPRHGKHTGGGGGGGGQQKKHRPRQGGNSGGGGGGGGGNRRQRGNKSGGGNAA